MEREFNKFKDIEVYGSSMFSIFEGLRDFSDIVERILKEHGIHKLTKDGWFPLPSWLGIFEEIKKELGPHILNLIGIEVPYTAVWYKKFNNINDIETLLKSINISYHLNHRKGIKVMYDIKTGKFIEGIGGYHLISFKSNSAVMSCDNPYPCEFDIGIIYSTVKRFLKKMNQEVYVHVSCDLKNEKCRSNGGSLCRYIIKW